MITVHGNVYIPSYLLEAADKIKHQNYKVNKIGRIQKNTDDGPYALWLISQLANLVGRDETSLDMVYFSACSGADPHVDMLDEEKFENTTYVVPLILPQGKTVIRAEEHEVIVEVGMVYEFDHTKVHSMTVEDDQSGCVVLMVAVKK